MRLSWIITSPLCRTLPVTTITTTPAATAVYLWMDRPLRILPQQMDQAPLSLRLLQLGVDLRSNSRTTVQISPLRRLHRMPFRIVQSAGIGRRESTTGHRPVMAARASSGGACARITCTRVGSCGSASWTRTSGTSAGIVAWRSASRREWRKRQFRTRGTGLVGGPALRSQTRATDCLLCVCTRPRWSVASPSTGWRWRGRRTTWRTNSWPVLMTFASRWSNSCWIWSSGRSISMRLTTSCWTIRWRCCGRMQESICCWASLGDRCTWRTCCCWETIAYLRNSAQVRWTLIDLILEEEGGIYPNWSAFFYFFPFRSSSSYFTYLSCLFFLYLWRTLCSGFLSACLVLEQLTPLSRNNPHI